LPLAGPAEQGELTRPSGAAAGRRTAEPRLSVENEADRSEEGPVSRAWPNGKAIDS
jgi:hypothetical protein